MLTAPGLPLRRAAPSHQTHTLTLYGLKFSNSINKLFKSKLILVDIEIEIEAQVYHSG